jgi:hypothetical protein
MKKPPKGKCQRMDRALSSAYSAGCRCDDCVAWQQAYYRWRRGENAKPRVSKSKDASEPPSPQESPYGIRARACQHARLVANRLLALQEADAMVLLIAIDHFEDMLKIEARNGTSRDASEADFNNHAFKKGQCR